jgi:hypothetical protein
MHELFHKFRKFERFPQIWAAKPVESTRFGLDPPEKANRGATESELVVQMVGAVGKTSSGAKARNILG